MAFVNISTSDRIFKLNFQRRRVPAPPTTEVNVEVASPAELKPSIPQNPPMWVWMVVLIVSVVGLLIMLFVLGVRSIAGGGFIFLPMMAVSMFMMFRGGMGRSEGDKQTKPQLNKGRGDYCNNLDQARKTMHDAQEAQAHEINWHHPDPRALNTLAGTARQWERVMNVSTLGSGLNNFGHVRIGIGATLTAAHIILPDDIPPPDVRETVSTVALREFGQTHQIITGVPRPLALFDQPIHTFIADEADRPVITAMLRAAAAQAALFHGPDELLIAAVTNRPAEWEPLKYAPHCADPEFIDKSGPARLIFPTVAAFLARFQGDLSDRSSHNPLTSSGDGAQRRMLVIIDDPEADSSLITGDNGKDGVAVLHSATTPSALAAKKDDRVYYLQEGTLMRYFTPITDWETA